MTANELDVRELPKPDKHPTIFATYGALRVGESFVLVNNHDPKHLREEFEADYPGGHEWEDLDKGPVWRIRIGKLTDAPPPGRRGHHELVLESPQSAARQEI